MVKTIKPKKDIQAIQWNGDNTEEIKDFIEDAYFKEELTLIDNQNVLNIGSYIDGRDYNYKQSTMYKTEWICKDYFGRLFVLAPDHIKEYYKENK